LGRAIRHDARHLEWQSPKANSSTAVSTRVHQSDQGPLEFVGPGSSFTNATTTEDRLCALPRADALWGDVDAGEH